MAATDKPLIDVRHLLKTYTVEQLNRTADEYFERFQTPDDVGRLLAKPFASVMVAPEVLLAFANLLQGLQLAPHLTILDFGAGPCWATRYLTQMGLRVIACDVSTKALELGKKGFELFPIQGKRHQPQFLHFDSHKLHLPDASVDRIFCQDAFHHVPNQSEVLGELARVLKPGGIAGFSEPGPNHSKSHVSQDEMRNFTVIENDIVIEEIWSVAEKAGFTHLRLGYFTPLLTRTTLEEYVAHVYHGAPLPKVCSLSINTMLRERRMFFLYKLNKEHRLSTDPNDHRAELLVEIPKVVPADTPIEVTVHARNTGSAVWLQSHTVGAYAVGVRLPNLFLRRQKRDLCRLQLPQTTKCGHLPGEEVTIRGSIPGLPVGRHRLIFDLLCEGLFWFSDRHGKATTVTLEAR